MLKLVSDGTISLKQGIAALTHKPAEILRVTRGALSPGFAADVCIFNLGQDWLVSSNNWLSQGINTPYWGQTFLGQVSYTLQAGEILYERINA
jgi:dihydroorotase